MKNKVALFIKIIGITAMAIMLVLAFCACKNNIEQPQTQQAGETTITTAEELMAFFESPNAEKAILANSIELGETMLTAKKAEQKIIIDGGGYSLTGSGDCVIRIEDSAEIELNNITIVGGMDTLGCMGNAGINGSNSILRSARTAINCQDKLTFGANSSFSIEAKDGYGITAASILMGKNSKLVVNARLYAVNVLKKELVIDEHASLDATTNTDYSAVKCTGSLILNDGSSFKAVNEGSYHGAQLDYIIINGDVTIKAKGGSKGAGMFIFRLEDEYTVNGYCKSELRKENGGGSIIFKED